MSNEPVNKRIIDSIKYIYKSKEAEGNMAGTSILIILIVLFIFYFYYKVTKSQVLLDWKNQKCNPKYLFFSYYMNPIEGQDPHENIQNNFVQCMKPYASILKTKPYKDFKNTTKTIGKNTESLSKYVEKINTDMGVKIKEWNDDYKKVDLSANLVDDTSDEHYTHQKNMFTQIQIYSQRIHDIIYAMTVFFRDRLLFHVSTNRKSFQIQDDNDNAYNIPNNNINGIKNYLFSNYWSICNNEYRQAFDLLQSKKRESNFNKDTTDFSKSINTGYDAIKKYQYLIDLIDEFNRQNDPRDDPGNSLLKDTLSKCKQLWQFDFNCQEILPNWTKEENL